MDAGAGRLVIEGRGGVSEVRVTAVLCASSQERLEGLSAALDGDRLTTDYPGADGRWGRRGYATIHLEVEVPLGTGVDVEDQSGSATISGVGRLRIEDGSGSVTVRGVEAVAVEDGSGSLTIEDVDGDVHVEDGGRRERIRYSDVRGSLDLPPARKGRGSPSLQ